MHVLRLVLAVALALVTISPASADDDVVWSRGVRGIPAAVAAAADGSVYTTGVMFLGDAARSVMTVGRYGPAGRSVWRRVWDLGDRYLTSGSSAVAAPGGGVYVGGSVSRVAKLTSLPVFPVIRRYAPTGRLLWKVRMPLPPEAVAGEVAGLAADDHGVIAAVDFYASTNYGGIFHDGELWAFDATGHLDWRRDFEAPRITGTFDGVGDVAIGPNGGVYAVGHVDRTHRDDIAERSDEDLTIQQLTRDGAVRWSRTLSDEGAKDRDDAVSVAVRRGLVVVGGYLDGRPATLAYQHAERSRAWVGAFDTDGSRLWSHRWGDRTPTWEVTSVAIAPWGPVYVAAVRARYRADASSVLRRYAPDGTLVEGRSRGGSIVGIATSDAAVYVATTDRLERWRP